MRTDVPHTCLRQLTSCEDSLHTIEYRVRWIVDLSRLPTEIQSTQRAFFFSPLQPSSALVLGSLTRPRERVLLDLPKRPAYRVAREADATRLVEQGQCPQRKRDANEYALSRIHQPLSRFPHSVTSMCYAFLTHSLPHDSHTLDQGESIMSVSLNPGKTPNYATVTVGALTLEFSYTTVIAFSGPDDSAVSVNAWGPTTGKHLNRVDGGDRASRVERDEFQARLAAQLKKLGL